MTYSFESEEYSSNTDIIIKPVVISENDMYILCDDGSKILLEFGAESSTVSGNVFTFNTDIEYTDGNKDTRIFEDVSKFRELHINDTVYSLE